MAAEKIRSLFNDPNNPTRLAVPQGSASIDDAIQNAEASLNSLRMSGDGSGKVEELTQLLSLAKGLLQLRPYFTDLSMSTVSVSGRTASDISNVNSTINGLQITNAVYQQILSGLVATAANAINSKVFLLNYNQISLIIGFFKYIL